ncbi:MAG: hypothetical protein JXR96_26265 [Deltaproteobacteria bacterium]|nr:hypothetical protein [Deltaproteobacteria bacterium]
MSEQRNAEAFSESIDACIVRGFLADRKAMFKNLARQGLSRGVVLERARQLGLTEQFLKKCAVGTPAVALRDCLGCGERFLSVGFQNRLCSRCRSKT